MTREHISNHDDMVASAVKRLVSQANVIARIGTLGGVWGVDLSAMHEALGELGPELVDHIMVTVPASFDRIAVATRVSRDRLAAIADPDQLRRFTKLAPEHAQVDLELEGGANELASTLRAIGGRSLADDCAQLASFGVGSLALDEVRECAVQLGTPIALSDHEHRGSRAWTFHFAHRNVDDDQRAATRARLLAVARRLGVTSPQCNLIDGLHEVLAKDQDSYAMLVVAPEDTAPQFGVRYRDVRWETVIRLMLGFHPKSDAGKKLGELAGAFDAESASAIELLLARTEPPAMRVAVSLGS